MRKFVTVDSVTNELPETVNIKKNSALDLRIEESIIIAQSVRDDADSGLFNGESGEGIPSGGTPLQYLRKSSDGVATEWADVSKESLDLGNVDNTSDSDKPISTQTQAALSAKADSDSVDQKYGTRGTTRRIYVRANGIDTNDGKTSSSAFREIKTAVESIDKEGPLLRGSIVIDVGAGIYKGGIRMPLTRGKAQDDFLKIIGPNVGHPNAPTAIIDYDADPTANSGVVAEDGAAFWLENIKVQGGFSIAADIRRNVYLWLRNFHADGKGVGNVGLAINSHCRYYVSGGLIENMVTNGIQELFHITRSFNNVSSNEAQMTIRNCEVGFQAKENCVGHLDYLNIEDCLTGVEMNGYCVTNVKSISLKRCSLGYANINSEVHNEGGIKWGTGVDANGRDMFTSGSGTELSVWGWVDSSTARTTSVGHRPLVVVDATYDDVDLVGPTVESDFVSFTGAIKARRYNTSGKRFQIVIHGTVNTELTAPYRILNRTAGTYMTDVTIPSGSPSGSHFTAKWDVVCNVDGNNQKVFSQLDIEGASRDQTYAVRNANLRDTDSGVKISGISPDASSSVTLRMVEIWG